jgi:hypothetical protein
MSRLRLRLRLRPQLWHRLRASLLNFPPWTMSATARPEFSFPFHSSPFHSIPLHSIPCLWLRLSPWLRLRLSPWLAPALRNLQPPAMRATALPEFSLLFHSIPGHCIALHPMSLAPAPGPDNTPLPSTTDHEGNGSARVLHSLPFHSVSLAMPLPPALPRAITPQPSASDRERNGPARVLHFTPSHPIPCLRVWLRLCRSLWLWAPIPNRQLPIVSATDLPGFPPHAPGSGSGSGAPAGPGAGSGHHSPTLNLRPGAQRTCRSSPFHSTPPQFISLAPAQGRAMEMQ